MQWMTRNSRRPPGVVAVALLIVLIEGSGSVRLLASDDMPAAELVSRRTDAIQASVLRLAPSEATRLSQDPSPAADPLRALCRASLVEKVGAVFSLGTGVLMFGYGLREKRKVDTIWTPDGKSEVILGAAAIGLSGWLFHDIWKRSHQCP
jgi:hypothetical protein